MADETSILAESKLAEATHAVAIAHEANANAREAQMYDTVFKAFREVLTEGDEGTKALLIKKIPLLCTDVMLIKSDIATIKKIGGVILLGIGMLFLTLVGSLLLSHVGVATK